MEEWKLTQLVDFTERAISPWLGMLRKNVATMQQARQELEEVLKRTDTTLQAAAMSPLLLSAKAAAAAEAAAAAAAAAAGGAVGGAAAGAGGGAGAAGGGGARVISPQFADPPFEQPFAGARRPREEEEDEGVVDVLRPPSAPEPSKRVKPSSAIRLYPREGLHDTFVSSPNIQDHVVLFHQGKGGGAGAGGAAAAAAVGAKAPPRPRKSMSAVPKHPQLAPFLRRFKKYLEEHHISGHTKGRLSALTIGNRINHVRARFGWVLFCFVI